MEKRGRRFSVVTILALSCIFIVSYSVAEIYQSELKIAPVKVYESILENFKNKKYEEVERALSYIQPVVDTIKVKFGLELQPEIQSALKAKSDNFYTAIERLIFYDIQIIFISIIEQGKGQSPQSLKLWFKMAYANYLLLSPIVLKDEKGFISDRKIKKMFKETYICLGSESPYGEKIPLDLELFRKRSDEIIGNIVKVFPEF
ncbi:MAG: hypothetical protein QME42_00380 [bacterium]|nr:hypothetical protein [bacterium]